MLSATFGNDRLGGTSVTIAPDFPVPLRLTDCGLPVALSVTDMFAERAPRAVGENVTAMLQLNPARRVLGQLLVCPKSPEFVPVTLIPVMVRGPWPLLVRLIFCGLLVVPRNWLPNANAGERLTSGTALVIPVPESVITRGLPGAVSVTVTVAVRIPAADGVNRITIVQKEPEPTPLPLEQLLPLIE